MMRSALRKLVRDTRAVALVEFAYILPIFVMLSLTGAELTNYITTRMRVSQLALHLADNASRIGTGSQLQAKTISESEINDLLVGAGYQSGGLNLYGNGRVIVSSLEPTASPNTAQTYKLGWRRCRGSASYSSNYTNKPATFSDGLGNAGRLVTAPDFGATIFVEVYYRYQPIVSGSLAPSTDMIETASMMVRDRRDTSGPPTNTDAAPISSC